MFYCSTTSYYYKYFLVLFNFRQLFGKVFLIYCHGFLFRVFLLILIWLVLLLCFLFWIYVVGTHRRVVLHKYGSYYLFRVLLQILIIFLARILFFLFFLFMILLN